MTQINELNQEQIELMEDVKNEYIGLLRNHKSLDDPFEDEIKQVLD